jgi:hypothetical protein
MPTKTLFPKPHDIPQFGALMVQPILLGTWKAGNYVLRTGQFMIVKVAKTPPFFHDLFCSAVSGQNSGAWVGTAICRIISALQNALHDPSHSSGNRLLPQAQGPR